MPIRLARTYSTRRLPILFIEKLPTIDTREQRANEPFKIRASGRRIFTVVISGITDSRTCARVHSQWPAVFSLRFVRRRSEVQRI